MSVFNIKNNKDHTKSLAFLDEAGTPAIQRFDTLKYRQFDKLTDKQLGFFWRPEEVDITKDTKDFRDLTEHEQHIFTSNLKRQIIFDSVQGRSPNLALLPIVTRYDGMCTQLYSIWIRRLPMVTGTCTKFSTVLPVE